MSSITSALRRVIEREASALQVLARTLPNDTHGILAAFRGADYIVTTGLGKSGYVARKVASAFASLGKPAFFLHAAEAMHGELGALRRHALLLAFSKSGTGECVEVARRAVSVGVPVIAITEDPDSPLAKVSDGHFILPAMDEVLHLAPTVSTTMMLALGDALAVVTCEDVTEDEFRTLHPGGAIGAA